MLRFIPLACSLLVPLLWVGTVPAAPLLGQGDPARIWQCREGPDKVARATLYMFDAPIEVDRYSPIDGIDSVAGINIAVEGTDGKGVVSEYTFGVVETDYQAFSIVMRFSARISPDGPRLQNFPQPARITIIDRITGEMRSADADAGTSSIRCETVAGTFDSVAAAYDRLIAGARKAGAKR